MRRFHFTELPQINSANALGQTVALGLFQDGYFDPAHYAACKCTPSIRIFFVDQSRLQLTLTTEAYLGRLI